MDLAEQIDDFIPSVQTGRSDMDSLIMLVFITSTSTLLLAFLGRLAYQKFVAYRLARASAAAESATPASSPSKTSAITTTATATTSALPATSAVSTPIKSLLQRATPAATNTANTQSAAIKASPFANRPTTRDAMRPAAPASKTRSLSQSSLTTAGGVRKRLSRASPGPDITRARTPKKSATSPENIGGVDETIVEWINKVFKWLYSDLVIVNDVLFGFITAVNQTMARNSEESEVIVEIVRILPESTVPNITNVFCDKPAKSAPSEVVVSMDVETTLIVQLKAFQQKAGKTEVLHYRANVRLKGHSSTHMNFGSLIGEMRLEGYPDIKITIASIGTIKGLGNEDKEVQNSIIESLNLSMRDAAYPIDFSMHATCPRAYRMEPENNIYDNRGMSFPSPYDMMTMNNYQSHGMAGMNNGGNNFSRYSASNLMQQQQQQQQMTQASRRLLVKIVKGEGLTHANDPFVSVEMDEPPQKNQTGARQGQDPIWDEHFLFDLSHSSSEILFEVYDRPDMANGYPKFLGLGLVGIDELSVGVASSQIIALQPRPYETDDVSGAITVEFVFIEGAQIPAGRRPYKLKEALKINGNGQFEPQQNFYDDMAQDQWHQQVDDEKNMNHQSLLSPRTTSSSHRIESNTLRPINYSSPNHIVASTNGDARADQPDNKSHLSPPPRALKQQQQHHLASPTAEKSTLNMKISMIQKEKSAEPQPPPPIDDFSENRGREKKRSSIFGTLKKRLSRSRTRKEDQHDYSTSNGNDTTTVGGTSNNIVQSNQTSNNKFGLRLGLPISRKSSFSEASAISNLSRMSSVSNKTFLHEASTLVLEVVENGVTRHYLVPMNVAQKPRWRRKGTKMHIYNDHTFIAKHLTSGLICEICLSAIPFRMGKQGYECRDCLLKCHKQCHVRTNQLCPKPTIQTIELCNMTDSQ